MKPRRRGMKAHQALPDLSGVRPGGGEPAFWGPHLPDGARLLWSDSPTGSVVDTREVQSTRLVVGMASLVLIYVTLAHSGEVGVWPLLLFAAIIAFFWYVYDHIPLSMQRAKQRARRYALTDREVLAFHQAPYTHPKRLALDASTRVVSFLENPHIDDHVIGFAACDADGTVVRSIEFHHLEAAQINALYGVLGLKWEPL